MGLNYNVKLRMYFNVPKGMHLHHKDGNCFNNHPNNIAILTPEEHRNIHIGHQVYKEIDGIKYKMCNVCKIYKPLCDFRKSKKYYAAYCNSCIKQWHKEYYKKNKSSYKERYNKNKALKQYSQLELC